MKPFIKWQGGKRRELDHILPYIPDGTYYLAEPFCGGAAVSFADEGIAFLNDTNWHLINLYQCLANPAHFAHIMDYVSMLKAHPEKLEEIYYQSRDTINSASCTFVEDALAFLIVRQQCFSGMERYHKRGEFNVPWGRYKTFSCGLTEDHHNFLRSATITHGDALECINSLPADTFVFLDPPYLDRAGYEAGDGGYDLHAGLAATLKTLDLPWLLVHSDHEFYRHAYADFNITEVPIKYQQQWKGRARSDAAVNHLYISNTSIS